MLLPEFVSTIKDLASDIKKLAERNPREAKFVIDNILQINTLSIEEIKLATEGVVESGDRAKLILNTLMQIQTAMMQLDGKRMYDAVPFNYMPIQEPIVNTNDPTYNVRYLGPEGSGRIDGVMDEGIKKIGVVGVVAIIGAIGFCVYLISQWNKGGD